jgi:hypothetical protein
MEEGLVSGEMVLPTDAQSTEIPDPGKGPLHFPTATIAPQAPSILDLMGPCFQMRTNEFDPIFSQAFSQFSGVIRPIRD